MYAVLFTVQKLFILLLHSADACCVFLRFWPAYSINNSSFRSVTRHKILYSMCYVNQNNKIFNPEKVKQEKLYGAHMRIVGI